MGACIDGGSGVPHVSTYNNFRALSSVTDTYSEAESIPIECLTFRNGYYTTPILSNVRAEKIMNCKISFPRNSSVVSGGFVVSTTSCTGAELEFDCFAGTFFTACAAFVFKNDTAHGAVLREVSLHTHTIFGNRVRESGSCVPVFPASRHLEKWIDVNNDTLAVIVRHLAHDPYMTPMEVFLVATHQAASIRTVLASPETGSRKLLDRLFFLGRHGFNRCDTGNMLLFGSDSKADDDAYNS